jgi:hypothetical protein
MNIFLPKDGKYNIGDDFPMISIPTDISELNPQDKTFDDFQWWAESSEFKKWMDANKRQWVADSEETTRYGNALTDLIKEHVESYRFENILDESDVLSFDEYDNLNEADAPLSAEAKIGIKFHYAYNKLKADGKLKNITSVDTDLPTGVEKAVFVSMEDPETKVNIDETLKAFKMVALPGSDDSKVKIISIKESLPGGPVDADTTMKELVENILKSAGEYAAIGAGIGVTWAILRRVGYGVAAGAALKTLRGLAPAASVVPEATKATGMLAKSTQFLKNVASGSVKRLKVLGIGFVDLLKFKDLRNAAKGAYIGTKIALRGKSSIPASKIILRGFTRGATKAATAAGAKGASRWIPFVGQALLAIDAIGSTWNWFSNNQAPKWDEIEDTIASGKGGKEFDPGKIEDGTSITICWKQPAGTGLGIAASFLYSNDTRTTAELFKVGKGTNGDSVFILTAINSKEYQKGLSDHAVTLISIKNGPINAQSGLSGLRRILDNEDMDVKVAYVDQPEDIATSFNFMGICDWSVLLEYYNEASEQYLISDSDAPETYEYYYQTTQKDYVNVSGKLLSDEELGSKSSDDIAEMFATGNNKINNVKPEKKEENKENKNTGNKPEGKKNKEQPGGTGDVFRGDAQIADSENNRELWLTPMVNESSKNGMVIHKFSEFEDVLEYINIMGKYPDHSTLNEDEKEEGTEADVKAKESADTLTLTNEEASGPAKVAVYSVTDMEYANPADRQYTPAAYKYFIIGPDDYDANLGSSIEVGVSTDETLIDPRRGVYEFKEEVKKEDNRDEGGRKTEPEDNRNTDDGASDVDDSDDENTPNKDDYFITADPDDISIKNRKNATVIRDKNFKGGINIVDEFLTDKEKEVLGIPTWKAVTLAKTFMNGQGEVIKVKLKNRYAPMFNTAKTYEVRDGEAFQIAKKFAKEVEDRIKFQ